MSTLPAHIPEAIAEVDHWSDEERGYVSWRTIISAGRTSTAGLSSGIAYFDAGGVLKKHKHEQPEVIHVLDGTGKAIVSSKTFQLQPRDTVFVPGNAWHEFHAGVNGLTLLYVFPADAFEEIEYVFANNRSKV